MWKCLGCPHFCCWVRNNPQSCDTSKLLSAWGPTGSVCPLPIYLPESRGRASGGVRGYSEMKSDVMSFHIVIKHMGLQIRLSPPCSPFCPGSHSFLCNNLSSNSASIGEMEGDGTPLTIAWHEEQGWLVSNLFF